MNHNFNHLVIRRLELISESSKMLNQVQHDTLVTWRTSQRGG